MSRRLIALPLTVSIIFLSAAPARAESPMPRLPILPSIEASRSPSVFTTSIALAPATTTTPKEGGLVASIGRELQTLWPSMSTLSERSGDLGPRDMRLRDRARDRDATTFGISRPAPMSRSGALFASGGLGAGATRMLVNLGRKQKLPVTLGPTMCQGGGGISLGIRW